MSIFHEPGFPESKENSSVHERLAGAVGYPSRVSRKGKAGPLEAGRGKYSPPANPERVTAGASERRDGDVLLERSKRKDYQGITKTHGLKVRKLRSTDVAFPFCLIP